MTPSSTTTAGRGGATKRRTAGTGGNGGRSSTPADDHRRNLRPGASPKAPRRVSGPRDGVAGGAQSAPARRKPLAPPRTRPTRRAATRRGTAPFPARAVAFVRGLPDLALIDRLLRGRVWIPLLGVMLAGIVAMQVELLKLNSVIGHSIDRGSSLQSQNEQLRATVASLADDQRIERVAAGMGMVMPAPDGVVFLAAQPGANVQQAVARMRAPDPASFAALQPAAPSGATATTGATAASTTSPAAAGTSGNGATGTGTAGSGTASTGTASTGTAGTADASTGTASSGTASSAAGTIGTAGGSGGAAATATNSTSSPSAGPTAGVAAAPATTAQPPLPPSTTTGG